jgi:antirestriction protein ArdC
MRQKRGRPVASKAECPATDADRLPPLSILETPREDMPMSAHTIFEDITRQIIEAIEAGAGEYRMPWHRLGQAVHAPLNATTGRRYRGVNVLLLWATAEAKGYSSGRWATYQQWRQMGGQVRRGEKATAILFWKSLASGGPDPIDQDEQEQDNRARLIARVYHVFNADQVNNLPSAPLPSLDDGQRIAEAEKFFSNIGGDIRHGGDVACYLPALDQIRMPHFSQFRSPGAYYSVLAHELTHWTGAKSRLDRDLCGRFGSSRYAMEELVAELGAAFLMAELGLPSEPRRDHAPYLAHWLDILREDSRAIVTAASKAQLAADFLIAKGDQALEIAA